MRIEASTTDARRKTALERHHSTLGLTLDAFTQHQHHGTFSIGEMKHLIFQRAPSIARDPDLAAARVVHVARNPTQGRVITQRPLRSDLRPAKAIISPRLHFRNL